MCIRDSTTDAFEFDEARTASQVEPLEQVIDILVERLRAQHIKRLKDGDVYKRQGWWSRGWSGR